MPTRLSGQKVRAQMLAANMTPTQLANKSELSASTIDRILNDRANNYSNFTVQRLADALHCSPFDLFTEQAINTTIAESAANAVADVVAEAVTEAVSVVVDEVAPDVSPEKVAESVPNMTVNAPPMLDVSAYFAYIQQNHREEIDRLEKTHAEENAERDKHLEDVKRDKNVWRCVALVLGAVICFWLLWDLSHPGTGMIQYAKSMGLLGRIV